MKGKKTLTQEELFIVFSSAFGFLKSIAKHDTAIKNIYTRIGKGSDPAYGAYLGWISRTLAKKDTK